MLDKNLRVLVVDDDLVFLDRVVAMLRDLGVCDVVEADCGENAVRALNGMTRAVDVILCNFGMPRGNGLQVLREVRLAKFKWQRPDSCFILMSSSRAPDVLKAAKDLDVSGYLLTPMTPEALATEIEKARKRVPKINFGRYQAVVCPNYVIGGAEPTPTPPPPAGSQTG